jgi:putative DNA primase/helicase
MTATTYSDSYIAAAIAGEQQNVLSAQDGGRNATLNRAAFALGSLGISAGDAIRYLKPAALQTGLRNGEIYSTINSGVQAGQKCARTAPEAHNGPSAPVAGAPRWATIVPEAAISSPDAPAAPGPIAALPTRSPLGADGKPAFMVSGDDGPAVRSDELRRHVYKRAGVPVRIKIKHKGSGFVNWYRVQAPDGVTGWQAGRPGAFVAVPYVGALNPFEPELTDDFVFWPEGEKDVDTLTRLCVPAFTFGGTGDGLPDGCESHVTGRHVVILADNDEAGRKHANAKAARVQAVAASVRIVEFPKLPPKGDVSDWIAQGHTAEQLTALADGAPLWMPQAESTGRWRAAGHNDPASPPREWPAPISLPRGLSKIDDFNLAFLPDAIAPWVRDIAARLQCPADYVAIAAMTALGAVIGRRIGIKPQVKTDWVEVPNAWGMFIGRPGVMKSPAMGEALKPIHHLEAEAAKDNEIALQAYLAGVDAFKLRKSVKASLEKDALKKDREAKVEFDLGHEPQEPRPVRYRTNDSSYEAIGELLIANPTGILIERDELVSLLCQLDRDDQAVARGFYLSGWSGQQPYTFDRIIRGHRHIEAACISVLGNTQPSRIAEYVRRANRDGGGGDGLLQRFGLLVYPDPPATWKDVDEYPDADARNAAWDVFDRLAKLTDADAIALGARKGPYDKLPCLRFDAEAGAEFLDWRKDLEARLRGGELSAALEGHLAKYRKLVPALALMNHLADGGRGDVAHGALLKALAFAKYLETHARRVYGASEAVESAAATAILARIRRGHLEVEFTARDVQRKDWSGLTDREHIQRGLDLLCELDHLAEVKEPVGAQGGRPKVRFIINPRTLR